MRGKPLTTPIIRCIVQYEGYMYGACRKEIFKIEKIVKNNESSI